MVGRCALIICLAPWSTSTSNPSVIDLHDRRRSGAWRSQPIVNATISTSILQMIFAFAGQSCCVTPTFAVPENARATSSCNGLRRCCYPREAVHHHVPPKLRDVGRMWLEREDRAPGPDVVEAVTWPQSLSEERLLVGVSGTEHVPGASSACIDPQAGAGSSGDHSLPTSDAFREKAQRGPRRW
jgi:hypothetical protein